MSPSLDDGFFRISGRRAISALSWAPVVRVHGGKRKFMFIKNDISRNVDATGGWIKTLVTLVLVTITKKHTFL
jgi:hypothetical protein